MRTWREFQRDERGNVIYSITIMAGAIAIASLAGAHFLEKAAQDGDVPHFAFFDQIQNAKFQRNTATVAANGGEKPITTRQVTIDYTPTASIPANLAQPIVLDPCTGIRK